MPISKLNMKIKTKSLAIGIFRAAIFVENHIPPPTQRK